MSRRYKLLGGLVVEEDGRASPLMKSDKGCALMAALILHGNPLRREYLADLFWDSESTSQSLTRLRVLLSRVKKLTPELQVGRKEVSFETSPGTIVDYYDLRQALLSEDTAVLDEGLRLYEGELLEGFYLEDAERFEEWLLVEQENLRQEVVTAYRRVCMAYVEQEAWLKGVDAARRWLLLDELDEEALRYLLQFLAASGQVEVALAQYEHSRERLWEEIGVEPEPETAELARRLEELKAETGRGIAWDAIVGAQLVWPEEDQLAEPGALPPTSYLPYQRNSDFTGRRDSLLHLAQQLLPSPESGKTIQRAAAITGMGGMGKTQLAVEFVYRYGRYFPGGVYWISFAQADEVAGEVALLGGERGMGLYKDADQLTLADQVGRVQKAWQEAVPRLLIFDNCEEETLLAEWLPKTGGCRVLLTSRRGRWARDLGVAQWSLPALDLPESVAFLRRLLPELDEETAAEIADEVGRLPLALHLAGGFLRRYPQISPDQYLPQLQDIGLLQHPSLQGRGAEHSPTGHELNVARTFALSMEQFDMWDEVDKLAQWLLACAACFAPGEPIPQELLRAVALEDGGDLTAMLLAEDGLERLVTLGFLESEGRESVVLHHLLAAYTLQEMAEGVLIGTAQTAVAEEMARILTNFVKNEAYLPSLPFSAIHLRHVTDAAVVDKAPLATNMAVFLGRHLMTIGVYDEAETILKQALVIADEASDVVNQIQALIALSYAQKDKGHDEKSLNSTQQAIDLLKQADEIDAQELAKALYGKGWAQYRLGQAQAALETANEGYAVSKAANLPREMAGILNLMGVVNYYLLGNYDAAALQLQEGLSIFRDLDSRSNQAAVLNNMGENARLQGDYAPAAAYYEEALEIARETSNRTHENVFLSNLCGARLRLGDFEEVANDLEELINRTQVDWYGASEAYRFLAEAYLGLGRTAEALEMVQQALALAHPASAAEHGRAWRVLGDIAAASGEVVQAVAGEKTLYSASECYCRSNDYFSELDLQRDHAISLWRWAQYELAQGNEARGEAMWQEAHEIFERLRLPGLITRMERGVIGNR